jgi:hypothetical protein
LSGFGDGKGHGINAQSFPTSTTNSLTPLTTMSHPPTSNGLVAPHHTPYMQTPLPPQQPGLVPSHDVSQPNPRDAHSNNRGYPNVFNNSDSFPLSAFSAFNAYQGFVPSMDPSYPSYINDQPPSNVLGPMTIPGPPLPQDGPSQYMPTSQTFQATCTCHTCVAHRTIVPAQFGGVEPGPALATQDATAPFAQTSPSSSRRGRTAPYARPPVLHAPMQYPGVIDAGLDDLALPTADHTGGARGSRRVSPVRNRRRRTKRETPLVRVEDRIEWVGRDLLKMTLWFNWSPDAEAKAHEPWGEPPRGSSSVGGVVPNGAVRLAPNVSRSG